eukprot:1194848-Rhodomonas_salina.2
MQRAHTHVAVLGHALWSRAQSRARDHNSILLSPPSPLSSSLLLSLLPLLLLPLLPLLLLSSFPLSSVLSSLPLLPSPPSLSSLRPPPSTPSAWPCPTTRARRHWLHSRSPLNLNSPAPRSTLSRSSATCPSSPSSARAWPSPPVCSYAADSMPLRRR